MRGNRPRRHRVKRRQKMRRYWERVERGEAGPEVFYKLWDAKLAEAYAALRQAVS